MSSAAAMPLLFIGGFLLVASKGRKKKSRGVVSPMLLPAPAPVPKVVSNWAQRQEALKFLAEHDICDSNPGAVDGKLGPATKAAVAAFQACVGIKADGAWGPLTEKAMLELLRKLEKEGIPTPKPAPKPNGGKWTPDDILVMDPECNQILHISDDLFKIQRKRAAQYALEGNTTLLDAQSIHQEIVEEYAPLCATLGKTGVGEGVRKWWDSNVSWVYNVLREYELLPEALEEDAEAFGL